MKPAEIIAIAREGDLQLTTWADHLRYLSRSVLDAQLNDGRRVLDAPDFRVWLEELATEAAKGMR